MLLTRPTVEEKVDVLAIEAVSTFFLDAGFILGEAGCNQVGGLSLGNSVYC